MDRINDDMFLCESEMRDIQESGSLFEVNIPEFKVLKQCRKELRMLKVPPLSEYSPISFLFPYIYSFCLCMFNLLLVLNLCMPHVEL